MSDCCFFPTEKREANRKAAEVRERVYAEKERLIREARAMAEREHREMMDRMRDEVR
jgi:hypothetical protein